MSVAVITGGAGFVGSHLADLLLESGDEVRIIDDLSTGKRENVPEGASFTEASILNQKALARVTRGADVLYHLAAYVSVPGSIEHPTHSNEVNVGGTVAILDAARKEEAVVVYMSSAAVYGSDVPRPVVESALRKPESPYGLQKMVGEEYVKLFGALFGLKYAIIRPFNIFGPRQRGDSSYAGVIARFHELVQGGKRPTIFGSGNATRDYVFVSDVVAALQAAGQRATSEGIIANIGTGKPTSVHEVLQGLKEVLNAPIEPEYREARVGDIAHSVADVSEARRALDWEARVEFKEGLRRLVTQAA